MRKHVKQASPFFFFWQKRRSLENILILKLKLLRSYIHSLFEFRVPPVFENEYCQAL